MGVDAANGLLTGGHPSYDFILSAESPVCPLMLVPVLVMRLDSVIIEAAADSCRGRGEVPGL